MKNPDPTRGRDTFKESVLQSPSPAAAGRRRRRRGRRRSVAPAPDRRWRRGRRRNISPPSAMAMMMVVVPGEGGSREGAEREQRDEELLVVHGGVPFSLG